MFTCPDDTARRVWCVSACLCLQHGQCASSHLIGALKDAVCSEADRVGYPLLCYQAVL